MDTLERPRCECHGEPMYRGGRGWQCAVRRREQVRQYYWANREKVREKNKKRAQARRVFFYAGGIRWARYVENKAEVLAARDAFRAQQKADYRREADVGFN